MKTPERLHQIEQAWRLRRPDLDPAPMLRLILLSCTARTLSSAVEDVLRCHGLNFAQADLLLSLYRSAPPEGLTPGELTNVAAVTPSSITNRLDRLEERGLVERHTDQSDARARRVRLTHAGRAAVETLLPDHLQNETGLLSALSAAEQHELDRLLLKLVTWAENRPAPGEAGHASE